MTLRMMSCTGATEHVAVGELELDDVDPANAARAETRHATTLQVDRVSVLHA
jgi:hypothetical protein